MQPSMPSERASENAARSRPICNKKRLLNPVCPAGEALDHAKLGERVRFKQSDVLDLGALEDHGFDVIVSERCIINLKDWEEQKAAILNMKWKLRPSGKLLLVENTQEGLAVLNSLRAQFGLHEIKTRWHNFYVPQKQLEEWLPEYFRIDSVENIGNLYYIMSRVLYASLARRSDEEPDYNHPINEIASQLPTLGSYSFSPNFLYRLTSSCT
jgi:SAM-dependent methyltransferase